MNEATERDVYDVLTIGLGPANLALAVALEEAPAEQQQRRVFLEAKPSHAWHPGMMLEGSLLQISVIKDLATVADPCSRFTFLNYLKEKGRLFEFLNLRELYPTREEFADYLAWAADKLGSRVCYGRRVTRIEPGTRGDDGVIETVIVEAENLADGSVERFETRNVVVATGGVPKGPENVVLEREGRELGLREMVGDRVLHSDKFLRDLERIPGPEAGESFLIVGAGQSAAELFLYLLERYKRSRVTSTIRRFAYKPADGSDFTNSVFFPSWTDYYYDLAPERRREFFDIIKDVNYAVIDEPLIHRIYTELYRQKVAGDVRGEIKPFMQLEKVEERNDKVVATYHHLMHDHRVELEADRMILCSGYDWPKKHPVLAPLSEHLRDGDGGGWRIGRDYRLDSDETLAAGIYLQGYCEDTHGISETVLSLIPIRAREILASIVAHRREPVLEMV
ncbi:MAG: SidA/IucD/PvdA family monooxygenase [Acidobacteriota bacterium]